ncbi:hypothetical protein FQA39_LY07537 [Lamprigera yunnana]|nr:hypothetical protein FQA39_LY07537 [Lamprigera yunnana]
MYTVPDCKHQEGAFSGGVASISLMGIIITGTQIYKWKGSIPHATKPLHSYGCNLTRNQTFIGSATQSKAALGSAKEEVFYCFEFHFIIITKDSDPEVNSDYLSPIVRKFMKKSINRQLLKETQLLNGIILEIMQIALFSWIDYVVFIAITAIGCGVGLYFGFFTKQTTVSDYLFGGKKMNWLPITMSLASSALSAVSLLGLPTEVYLHGTQITLIVFSLILSAFANYVIFLPIFYKLQLVSVYDYLEMRFHKYLRSIASFLGVVNGIFLLPLLMYAPCLIFSQVSGVDVHIIAPIMILICVFYTTIGGVKAVIWVDTFQFLITLITLIFVIITGIQFVGGIDKVYERALKGERLEFLNFNLDPTIRTTVWSSIIGYTFLWSSAFLISPQAVQRFVSLPTQDSIKWSLSTLTISLVLAKGICFLLGLIIFAYYHDCDPYSMKYIKKPDQIVAYYIMEVTSGIIGFSGLFASAFFGSAFSAFSTTLNTFAGIVYSSFAHLLIAKGTLERRPAVFLKVISVLIGLSSIALIYLLENIGTIFEAVYYIKGITDGAVLGIFLLGTLCPIANTKGAFSGGVASVTLMGIIIIGTQIYKWNGSITHATKPLHTYGCNVTNNQTFIGSATKSKAALGSANEEVFWLFRISFHYYYVIGTITALVIGLLISWITKRDSDPKVNSDYQSPIICKFLKKRINRQLLKETNPLKGIINDRSTTF